MISPAPKCPQPKKNDTEKWTRSDIVQPFKRCTKCKRTLAESQFHQKGQRLASRCKECVSKSKKAAYRRKKRMRQEDIGRVIFSGEPDVDKFAEALESVLGRA